APRMSPTLVRLGSYSTLATWLTRFTCADVTPSVVLRTFSMAGGQCGHVIPPTRKSIFWPGAAAPGVLVTALSGTMLGALTLIEASKATATVVFGETRGQHRRRH